VHDAGKSAVVVQKKLNKQKRKGSVAMNSCALQRKDCVFIRELNVRAVLILLPLRQVSP
jgi:hypothetical protein